MSASCPATTSTCWASRNRWRNPAAEVPETTPCNIRLPGQRRGLRPGRHGRQVGNSRRFKGLGARVKPPLYMEICRQTAENSMDKLESCQGTFAHRKANGRFLERERQARLLLV